MDHSLLMGISHTAFNCADIEKSLHFYRDLLGFKFKFDTRIPEDVPEDSRFYALRGRASLTYLQGPDGSYLELFTETPERAGKDPDDNRVGYAHMSIRVSDIRAAAEQLKAEGVHFDSEISFGGPDHTYKVWIRDPDGNRIELMEYTPESLQL